MFRITDGILLAAAASLAVFLWRHGKAKHARTAAEQPLSRPWTLDSHPALTGVGRRDADERYRKFRLN